MDASLSQALSAAGMDRFAVRLAALNVDSANAFLSLAASFSEGPISEAHLEAVHSELRGMPPTDVNWPRGHEGSRAILRLVLELRAAVRAQAQVAPLHEVLSHAVWAPQDWSFNTKNDDSFKSEGGPSSPEVEGSGSVAEMKRKLSSVKEARGKPVKLEVLRTDLVNIMAVEQVRQVYLARVFVQLCIKDGQLDNDLMADTDDPEPKYRHPRPGAMWFLHSIEFLNSLSVIFTERKVTQMGKKDLHLVLRAEGTFMQRYHLQAFPFDTQLIQLSVVSKQANEGVAPVCFVIKGRDWTPKLNLPTAFALADEWELGNSLHLEEEVYAPTPDRTYPVICFEACLRRKPAFYLLNICVPSESEHRPNIILMHQTRTDRLEISFCLHVFCFPRAHT